jgi:hypothetical protein
MALRNIITPHFPSMGFHSLDPELAPFRAKGHRCNLKLAAPVGMFLHVHLTPVAFGATFAFLQLCHLVSLASGYTLTTIAPHFPSGGFHSLDPQLAPLFPWISGRNYSDYQVNVEQAFGKAYSVLQLLIRAKSYRITHIINVEQIYYYIWRDRESGHELSLEE